MGEPFKPNVNAIILIKKAKSILMVWFSKFCIDLWTVGMDDPTIQPDF